jgi:hypothetical protein
MKTVPVFSSLQLAALAVATCFCLQSDALAQGKTGERAPMISEINGYTIRVVRLRGAGFGYEIRKGEQMLVRETGNPYTGSVVGLASSGDAMKTATWLVNTVLKKEQLRPPNMQLPPGRISGMPIPVEVARELGVAVE